MPRSDPERDRRLARKPRYAWRNATGLGDLVSTFMRSDEVRRMKRFTAVAEGLAAVLPEARLARIRAVGISQGALTLEVADSVLLAELRSHHQAALLAALAEAGAGVTRITWRLARG